MGNLGTMEILIIVGILVLLFGAKKLPELARGSGRALRIFKAETKGLMNDDDEDAKTAEQKQLGGQRSEADAYRVESQRVDTPMDVGRTDTDR